MSDTGGGGGGGGPAMPRMGKEGKMQTPPNPIAKHFEQMELKPLLYGIILLCVPLGICILTLIFLFHSAFLTACADLIWCWIQYFTYLLWHRRGTTHSQLASNVMLLNYQIPLLLALVTLRMVIQHTMSQQLPHTSQRKRRIIIGFGIGYIILIWSMFYSVVESASLTRSLDLSSGHDGVTPSSLFLDLYTSTIIFTILSFVSTFWVPTSDEALRRAEQVVLKGEATSTSSSSRPIPTHYAAHHSYILLESSRDRIDNGSNKPDENEGDQSDKTLPVVSPANPHPTKVILPPKLHRAPLVFLHGYGAGKGFWSLNLPSISSSLPHTRVYALDLLGMGCSAHQFTMSRCQNSADAEQYFVDGLEAWRKTLGLEKIILVGHSFGGYVASCYSLKYPERVEHLILVSPVGLPETPPVATPDGDEKKPNPLSRAPAWAQRFGIIHIVRWLWSRHITLSMGLHWLGPIGPFIFRKIVRMRFQHLAQQQEGDSNAHSTTPTASVNLDALADYTYHLNAGACPGHRGLSLILKPGAYAIDPLLPRLSQLSVGVSSLFGSSDWIDATNGHKLTETLLESGRFAECLIVERAGHQLFLENRRSFNHAIVTVVKAMRTRKEANKMTTPNMTPTATANRTAAEVAAAEEEATATPTATLQHRTTTTQANEE